jgi:hypothetical protein
MWMFIPEKMGSIIILVKNINATKMALNLRSLRSNEPDRLLDYRINNTKSAKMHMLDANCY